MNALAIHIPYLLMLVIGLAFIVQIIWSFFSAEIRHQMRRYPILQGLWGAFGLFALFLFFSPIMAIAWPPAFIERWQQHRAIARRIESSGGWSALRSTCESLTSNAPKGFLFFRGWGEDGDRFFLKSWFDTTNQIVSVPPIISNLHPQSLQYNGPQVAARDDIELPVNVVRFRVFGAHSTGGHSIPYLGLEVVSGQGAEIYRPKYTQRYRKIAPGIYEVF